MSDFKQYLRLVLGDAPFLLPGTLRYSIEQRESLAANTLPASKAAAWWTAKSGRWPAYALDASLRPAAPATGWQRALFLEDARMTVGIIVEDVQLLPRDRVQVTPFTPLGPAPSRHGPVFSGAWVQEGNVVLVLEPRALTGYLQDLAG